MTVALTCWSPFCTNGRCDGVHHTGMGGDHWDEPLTAANAVGAMPNGTRVLATVQYRTEPAGDWKIVSPALNVPHPNVELPLASLLNYLYEGQPIGQYQLWINSVLKIEGIWTQSEQLFIKFDEQADIDEDAALADDQDAAMADEERWIALGEEQSDSIEYGLDA